MSQNIGTLISSAIRPNDSNDPIASAFANEIKGGHHGYATLSERDSIIFERREWGMLVTVYNDGVNNATYQLSYNYVDTDIMNDSNWIVFNTPGGSSTTEWLDSVIQNLLIEPGSPSIGDRYLVGLDSGDSPSGANWGSYVGGFVAEWISALSWQYTFPTEGTSVVVDSENIVYKYEGGSFPSGIWVKQEVDSQVRQISATGNGVTYSATSIPSFATYSREIIYLTDFNTTNIGVPYLNINNSGDTIIKKTTTVGLSDLAANDLQPGVVYNLIYDGTYFQTTLPVSSDVVSTNIRITALGTDSYSGAATPSISTYSISDLYLVDFENVNTGATAVMLNIDSLGSYEVITFDENGPISLTGGGEINAGQIYYVTWDGNNFQMFDTNPQPSSPVLYTNPSPVPTTIGGIIAGFTFSNTTMKQMWDLLLYPYQQPNFTAFSFNYGVNPKEVGQSIIAGTYTFTWNTSFPANITTNSITIKDVTAATNLIVGTANDFSAPLALSTITKTSAANHQWKISAMRTNSTVISSTLTLSWRWRIHYGTQSATSLTASQVQALSTSALVTTEVGTYNFGSQSYKYFAWPTVFGPPTFFKDSATNLAVAMAGIAEGYTVVAGIYYAQTMALTNAYGITTTYYVFRTKNILGGSISIVVT